MPSRLRMSSSGSVLGACLVLLALAFMTPVVTPAWAPHQTGHPLRIVVPLPAGSPGDAVARTVADTLRKNVSYQVLVENRPGAGGAAAAADVKDAKADGGTLLFSSTGLMLINPLLMRNFSFDPIKDFAPVSQVGTFDYGLAVAANFDAKSLKDFVAFVKAKPELSYATQGVGSLPHLIGAAFAGAANINLTHVPYRGSTPALADLMAGRISTVVASTVELAALNKEGRARVLAVSGKERSPLMPDVPTFAEAGYNLNLVGWYGLFARADTPRDVIDHVSKHIVEAAQAPETRERLRQLGLVVTGTTPGQFAEIRSADARFWAETAKAAKLSPQ